jgi:hypothetical protein
MHLVGQDSNRGGLSKNNLVHLVGQLSNPSAALAAVFEAPTVAQLRPRKPRQPISPELVSRRLGNGVVQRAVVKVLAAARRPMRVAEIHLAVERLLGHPVSENSVGWCLAAGVHGKLPRFDRIARGSYQIRARR